MKMCHLNVSKIIIYEFSFVQNKKREELNMKENKVVKSVLKKNILQSVVGFKDFLFYMEDFHIFLFHEYQLLQFYICYHYHEFLFYLFM